MYIRRNRERAYRLGVVPSETTVDVKGERGG